MDRRPLRRVLILAALTLLIAVQTWRTMRRADEAPPDDLREGQYDIRRVVDGDTLLLPNGARVRLTGVDTPESVKPDAPVEPFGPEASAFTRKFLERGQARLQFDRERVDQHGRWLAYVWVEEALLNEELLRAGLARWEPHYHYSEAMKRRFKLAQAEAQQAGRGIWSRAGN